MQQIKVNTIVNGYETTINGEELFFFNEESLVLGIAHHIGSATVKDISLYRDSLNQGKSPVAYFTERISEIDTELAKVRDERDDKTLINRNLRDELTKAKHEIARLKRKIEKLNAKKEESNK